MPRRTRHGEQEIGSDSFLDVIANIVGILIILIVVAGLRVSQAPVKKIQAAEASIPAPHTAPENTPAQEPAPIAAAPAPLPDAPAEPIGPPPELLAEQDALTAELDSLNNQLAGIRETWTDLNQTREDAAGKISEAERLLRARLAAASDSEQQAQTADVSLRELQRLQSALLKELTALEEQPAAVKKIEHRMTPLARSVQGEEIHLRLAGNKVSVVPIAELIKQLLKQAERHKEWLAKFRQHQATVGPVDGYLMHYTMERQAMPVAHQVREGGVFRVAVSEFRLEPEPSLKAETAEEALRVGSKFHQALQTAEPGAVLTFWVYPDSFTLYRRLQAIAHDAGFQVAARPLPTGVPISGSPQGSRSAAQ